MTQFLYATDEAGNRCKVIQRLESVSDTGEAQGEARLVYTLDDGTPVRRVDSDTFQVIGTGAYISAVDA